MVEKLKLVSVFLYTAILFIISTIFMYIGKDAEIGFLILIIYLLIVIVGVILANKLRNIIASIIISLIIPAMLGYILGPTLKMYIKFLSFDIVFLIFLGASGIFTGAALFGYFTKKDLSKLGTILFFSLLFVIIMSFIGIFGGFSSIFFTIIAGISLLIFTMYTAYDVYRLKQNIYTMQWYEVPLYGLDLFINLINIFLDLLRLALTFLGDD